MSAITNLLWSLRDYAPLVIIFAIGVAWLLWRRLYDGSRYMQRHLIAIITIVFGFILIDWLMLAALPALGLSFGPVTSSLAALTTLRVLARICVYILASMLNKAFPVQEQLPQEKRSLGRRLTLVWLVNLALLGAAIYSMYLEPFDLRVSQIDLPGPAFLPDRPLRILHLSDMHVERFTKREEQLIKNVQAHNPDLILLTGDYLNIDYKYDPIAQQHGRRLLSQLAAPYGVYAVAGTSGVDPPDIMQALFNGLDIQILDGQVVQIPMGGDTLYLLGINTLGRQRDSQTLIDMMAEIPASAYSLLLYHTPDMIEAADQAGVDLYLAGHTHCGQVRLPFYGALVTMSFYGKKYESGLYTLTNTTLYVSRGIGMEGLRLPRLRFLCPPEMVLINLGTPSQGAN
ncbi:metallophosphoesterase [Chloroflexota bacterium]